MKILYSLIVVTIIAILPRPAGARDLTLIENGKSKVVIYVEPTVMEANDITMLNQKLNSGKEQWLRESVTDLAQTLEKISGAKVPILTTPPPVDSKGVLPILIGQRAVAVFGPPGKKSPLKQGFRLVVSPRGIGMIGESSEAVTYAIYELLDRLGCRWFMPSEMGESLPQLKTVRLPEMDVSHIPATFERNIWYADDDFRRRNRLGGLQLRTGHALEFEYLDKKLLEENLEWNALRDGKRSINGRLCTSNPHLVAALSQAVSNYIDKYKVQSVSLSPDDGVGYCECDNCKALDAGDMDPALGSVSLTDRFVHLWNQIATHVTKKHPDMKFGVLLYTPYGRPPVREKPHPNLVFVIAPITYSRAHSFLSPLETSRRQVKSAVDAMSKMTTNLGWYEYAYNLAEVSVPNPMITKWSEELPYLYAKGLKYWQPETMPTFEASTPGLYMGIRLSWYTSMKPQAILDEFYTRFYGPAARPMRTYWRIFDDAWAKSPEEAGSGFGYTRRFPPRVLGAARVAMNEALKAAKPKSVEWQRIQITNESLTQFETFMKMARDFSDIMLTDLEQDGANWMERHKALATQYKPQYAFTEFLDRNWSAFYFDWFFYISYKDGSRIARDSTNLTLLPRDWKYAVDTEKSGEQKGWHRVDFNDAAWKKTNPADDTWSKLGLMNYFGPVWYRSEVVAPPAVTGKKTMLWMSKSDGAIKVFVNGQHVPYVNDKGETTPEFSGWCEPASFDVSAAIKPGFPNQITLIGTRKFLNELGTGGLMGPVALYQK